MIGKFLSVQRGLLVFAFLVFLISGPQAALSTGEKSYDVLIKGGTIYDGTLKLPYVADIGIKNDEIAAIGILSGEATKTLDASGFIVTPGFIDIHEHSDLLFDMITSGEEFNFTPAMKENLKGNFNALYQGVTTVVTGNCGNGISDTEKWFGMIESMNFGTNVMHLVPHGKLRQELFGPENQPGELNSKQLRQLKARVEKEMKKGAWGMSTGLAYSPGIAARTEELIELAKVVGKYGGIYATHMRDESGMVLEDGRIALLESIREAIEIGRRAGVPVQISHLKLSAPYSGVKAPEILGLIEEARSEGLDITADSYPYTAGFTEISILLPTRFKRPEGGIADHYKTKEGREEIKDFIQKIFVDIPPEKIKIVLADEPTYQGKTVKEIAALEGKDPADCYADLVCDHSIAGIIFALNEQTMREFMPNHYVFTSSDGMTWPKGMSGGAHPRYFGAFARKLKFFAMDGKRMGLNDAIRSMTYLPAEKLGLTGRGKIEQGAFADIAVLDLNTLTDKSTYERPNTYAEGIVHLLVNGIVTIENRNLTGRRGGRALKGRGKTENKQIGGADHERSHSIENPILAHSGSLPDSLPVGGAGMGKRERTLCFTVDPSMGRRVQETLDAAVTEYNVPGAILALGDMNGNTRIWTSGLADLETGESMSEDLYFPIGSVTKSYTATMVLQLVDDGLIKLDEPIGKYLPGLLPRENEITIRHLLEMRSGLGEYGANPEFGKFMEGDPLQACTPEQLIKFSLDKTGEPDKEFHYTNANYILLGMLIEKVTNNSFFNEMQRRILQPLGMSHTSMLTEMKMPTPYARGYRYEGEEVLDGTYSVHPSLFWTAGGIVSTVGDQLIWTKALLEGRLLSPQTHSDQFTMKPASSKLGFYGFGVMNMNGLIGHGGNYNNLYTSFVGRYHGYDCVILVNGQTGDAEEKTFRAKAILQKIIKETGL